MKRLLPYLLLIALSDLSACRKNKNSDPAPVNPHASAMISGKIAPLDMAALAVITVTNTKNQTVYTPKPDAAGAFAASNLPAGNYLVAIGVNALPFTAHITLAEGQKIDVETITLARDGSFTLNGTASITGTIKPVGAGAVVTATIETPYHQYTGTINAAGQFTISNLPAGNYQVSASAAAHFTGFQQPRSVITSTGGITDAGEFLFYTEADATKFNLISYELDGVKTLRYPNVGVSYSSPVFALYDYAITSVKDIQIDQYRYVTSDGITLLLDAVTGPGTYPCKGTATSTIRVFHRDIISKSGGGPSPGTIHVAGAYHTWSTTGTGGSGTVTITSVDLINRTFSGTFSATLIPEDTGTTGNRVITNGVFTNFAY